MRLPWVCVLVLAGCGGGGGGKGNADDGDPPALHGTPGKSIEALAVARSGGVAVASDGKGLVRLDLHTGATTATPTGGGGVLALSADGAHTAAIADRKLTIDGAEIALPADTDPIGVAFAADGAVAVASEGSDELQLLLLDGQTHAVRATTTAGGSYHADAVHCRVTTSARGDLAIATCGGHAAAIRLRDGAAVAKLDLANVPSVDDIAEPAPGTFAFVGTGGEFSEGRLDVALPDGATASDRVDEGEPCALAPSARLVACGSHGDRDAKKAPAVEVRTTAAKLPTARRITLPAEAERLAFTPDGTTLVIGLGDGRLATVDVHAALAAAPALPAAGSPIAVDVPLETDVAAKPAVVTRTYVIDGAAKDDEDDEPLYVTRMSGLAASPDGKRLALFGGDGIELVDAATAKKLHAYDDAMGTRAAAWSADGKTLETLSSIEDHSSFGTLAGDHWERLGDVVLDGSLSARALAWTRDGKQFVAPDPGGGLGIRGITDGARARQIKPGAGEFLGFALGGEDRLVAWTYGSFAVWNLATDGKHALPTVQHHGPISAAAWSPDGARFVTVSQDTTAIIWTAATLAPEHVLHAHGQDAIAWSPDGAHLAIAGSSGIAIWRVADGKPVARITAERLRPDLFAWLPNAFVIGKNRDLAWLAVPKL